MCFRLEAEVSLPDQKFTELKCKSLCTAGCLSSTFFWTKPLHFCVHQVVLLRKKKGENPSGQNITKTFEEDGSMFSNVESRLRLQNYAGSFVRFHGRLRTGQLTEVVSFQEALRGHAAAVL